MCGAVTNREFIASSWLKLKQSQMPFSYSGSILLLSLKACVSVQNLNEPTGNINGSRHVKKLQQVPANSCNVRLLWRIMEPLLKKHPPIIPLQLWHVEFKISDSCSMLQ